MQCQVSYACQKIGQDCSGAKNAKISNVPFFQTLYKRLPNSGAVQCTLHSVNNAAL